MQLTRRFYSLSNIKLFLLNVKRKKKYFTREIKRKGKEKAGKHAA